MKNGERWKRNLLTWLWIQRRQQQQWFWSRWLSSAYVRPLFIGLFVPCSCFQSLSFCFLALVLCLLRLFFFCVSLVLFLFTLSSLLFLFFVCVCPFSLGLFFLFFLLLSHALSFSVFFCSWLCFGLIFLVQGWRWWRGWSLIPFCLSPLLPGYFFLCLCSVLLCLFPHWFPVLAFSNLPPRFSPIHPLFPVFFFLRFARFPSSSLFGSLSSPVVPLFSEFFYGFCSSYPPSVRPLASALLCLL